MSTSTGIDLAEVNWLRESGENKIFRASIDVDSKTAWSMLTGEDDRKSPLQGRWAMGATEPSDFVFTTLVQPLLVSETVRRILTDHHFSGWDVVPVEMFGKSGKRLPDYYFLKVLGRCGPLQPSESDYVDKRRPGGVFRYARGLYFEPGSWDGSDTFMAPSKGYKFVLQSVRDALLKADTAGIEFEPITAIETKIGRLS